MGWPPAVVIVVRHGARLDAADNQWHLTSPTPYDPPLTYGGWNQSRALGARIANILRTRETDDELLEDNGDGTRRKRRHKVIIHSSPFLRCVQTSVAISAGLAQTPGHMHPRPSSSHSTKHSSPRIRAQTGSPSLAPIPEPVLKLDTKLGTENIRKSTVRIDAFLGEWLSPDYFESITPPPSSVMMLAGAKADLLRNEDYTYLTQRTAPSTSSNQGFPGGWQSPVSAPFKYDDETPLTNLSSLAQALPRRDRTSSLSSVGTGSTPRARSPNHLAMLSSLEHGVYQPPNLTYATSPVEPIPAGIVAHARDACVNVDYQWDSMREPQQWGNGGEYGEEWSSMHKRFRTGFQKMNSWYEESEDPGKILSRSSTPSKSTSQTQDEDEDTDLVLVLVTHGAGCNALIGALTNQPVLLDVGLSSLTMAVRKPPPANTPASTPAATPKSHSRANSRNITISDQYEVKLIANTEHLRNSAISTPASSRTPSIAGIFRERESSIGSSLDSRGFAIPKISRPASSGNFGSIRRAASVATGGPKGYTPSSQGSIGLWSAPVTPAAETSDEPEDDMILNFGDEDTAVIPPIVYPKDPVAPEHELDEKDDIGPLGLWGSPRPPGEAEIGRESGTKRRWTVNER